MLITGTKTSVETIHVSEATLKDAFLDMLRKRFDIPENAYILNGNLVLEYEVWNGSHSSFNTEHLRIATEEDVKVVELIEKINNIVV